MLDISNSLHSQLGRTKSWVAHKGHMYICHMYTMDIKRFLSNFNLYKSLSWLFQLHFNTYIMGMQPLYFF